MKKVLSEQLEISAEKQGNTDYSHKIIEREHVDNTPFIIITTESGAFIALGENRISDLEEDKQKLIDSINKIDWKILINTILVIIEKQEQIKNTKQ